MATTSQNISITGNDSALVLAPSDDWATVANTWYTFDEGANITVTIPGVFLFLPSSGH